MTKIQIKDVSSNTTEQILITGCRRKQQYYNKSKIKGATLK